MQNSQTNHPLLRILRDVILLDILIFLLIGIIHLLAGWKTLHQYGIGLVWAGAIGLIFLLVNAGWRDGRRQDLVALSQLMREHEVFYLLNRDNNSRARFLLVGLIALVISFVIGLVLLQELRWRGIDDIFPIEAMRIGLPLSMAALAVLGGGVTLGLTELWQS